MRVTLVRRTLIGGLVISALALPAAATADVSQPADPAPATTDSLQTTTSPEQAATATTATSVQPDQGAAQEESVAGSSQKAGAQEATTRAPARIGLHVLGDGGGGVHVGHRVRAVGRIRPFVAGQHVKVWVLRNRHTVQSKILQIRRIKGTNAGHFHLRSDSLVQPGRYQVRARHEKTASQEYANDASPRFHISYPDLDPGDRGPDVRLFSRLISRQAYYTHVRRHYDGFLQRAVLAFRKVNGMSRTSNATPGIFRTLAAHNGGFHLRYPGAGRHVEVDISRQVMVFARHRRPVDIFHVSTGAPATPTIRGHYRFYSKDPGYNSERMYYSVYFHGGYATHGYDPVPTYPASHGCVRNPIPDSIFIYNWIHLGESIYLYG